MPLTNLKFKIFNLLPSQSPKIIVGYVKNSIVMYHKIFFEAIKKLNWEKGRFGHSVIFREQYLRIVRIENTLSKIIFTPFIFIQQSDTLHECYCVRTKLTLKTS